MVIFEVIFFRSFRLPIPRNADFAGLKNGEVARDDHFAADGKINVDFVKR